MRNLNNGRQTIERGRELYKASRKLVRKGSAKARSFILSMPLLSTLAGVAAGITLGMLLRSRK